MASPHLLFLSFPKSPVPQHLAVPARHLPPSTVSSRARAAASSNAPPSPTPTPQPEGVGPAAPSRGDQYLGRQLAAAAAARVLAPEDAEKRRRRKEKRRALARNNPTGVSSCYGCGAPLHTGEEGSPGYVEPATYELKKRHNQLKTVLCGRCKLLSHGHMVTAVGGHGGYPGGKQFVSAEELREKLSYLRHEKALIVKLVDIVDFNGSFLGRIRDFAGANPIVLVITKVNLLPRDTDLNCIGDWVVEAVVRKKLNVLSVYLTSSKSLVGITGVISEIQQEKKARDVYILGSANVGKSAFISAMLKTMAYKDPVAAAAQKYKPIQSAVPGTTLGPIQIEAFLGGGKLYDTPGVHLHHRQAAVIHADDLPSLAPQSRLRGRCFPANDTDGGLSGNTLFWGGLVRIDVVKALPRTRLTFYGPKKLAINMVPTTEAEEFYKTEVGVTLTPPTGKERAEGWCGLQGVRELQIKYEELDRPACDIAISGLGWISVEPLGVPSNDPDVVTTEEEGNVRDLEDGYTLHLVARRTAEGQHSSGNSDESTHANVNIAGNGAMLGDMSREIDDMLSEGMINDMTRTVRDILGSFGLGMPGGVANATFSVPLTTAPEGANNVSGRTQPGNPAPPGFSILNHHIQVSQLQPGGAIPRNMVIPDSLTTLVEYINRMDQVLQNNGIPSVDPNAQQPPRSDDAYLNQRFPSPEVLVSVIERVQQLLGGSASSALSHLAEHIQRDAATGDTAIRAQIQNESAQLGVAMQHLGAMFLELGRTMMMLRMGTSPANAFVNAGSAVYINPTGPNPIMVQPSFQSAPQFGVSSVPVLSGVSGAFGIIDPSRISGANIHGGASATSGPSAGTTTAAVNGDNQNVERTQGGNPSANSARGLPPRTVVAAVPARSPVEAPNHVLGVILPVQVRNQVAAPNQSTVPQGSQTSVSNGSQPNSAFVIPQASADGGISISSIVAQITAQVANALTAIPPGQVSSPVQNTADHGSHPTANSGASTLSSAASGNTQAQADLSGSHHEQTSLNVQSHVTGTGCSPSNTSDPNLTPQASGTANVSSVNSIQHTHTRDVPLSMSVENSEQKNKPSDGVMEEPVKPSASVRSEPVGLGGGLQPKRRSRTAKPSGTSSDSGEPLATSSASRNQDAVSVGQQVLQALVSKNTDVSSGSVTDSQPLSSRPQFAGGVPPRRPGGEGQVDISSMLSSVLNNPAFGNLVSNVAAQTGIESPSDLRGMMEEFTQNPAMMDTIGNIVQNVDGPGRGQGGFDLSRMMQQMMPVMSQVLGGATARPAGTNSGESRSQPRHSDAKVGDTSDGRNTQIDLHQARESIEHHDSPEDIFGAVLETAGQVYGEDESIQVMLEELASDPELTDDYMKLLLQQVGERVKSESETKKQS